MAFDEAVALATGSHGTGRQWKHIESLLQRLKARFELRELQVHVQGSFQRTHEQMTTQSFGSHMPHASLKNYGTQKICSCFYLARIDGYKSEDGQSSCMGSNQLPGLGSMLQHATVLGMSWRLPIPNITDIDHDPSNIPAGVIGYSQSMSSSFQPSADCRLILCWSSKMGEEGPTKIIL